MPGPHVWESRMRLFFKLVSLAAMALCSLHSVSAQDLRPRAYIITPVHTNAVIVGYAFNDGSIFFGSVLPITTPRDDKRAEHKLLSHLEFL